MTNTKTTKRALVASILSLLLCVSMLIGSTFAWFTDTATTGVNTIQAGELDVALMMKGNEGWVDAENQTLDFKSADNRANDKILWEPGATYELPEVKVVNNGNLALKFNLRISGLSGDIKLAEVLEVIINGTALTKADGSAVTLADLMDDVDGVAHGVILPLGAEATETNYVKIGETSAYKIALHMAEEADNTYQKLKLSNMALTVYASQYTFEQDSFDDKYDAGATYDGKDIEFSYAEYAVVNVSTSDELNTAIANATVPTMFVLADGTYSFPHFGIASNVKNKDLVFTGSRNVEIKTEIVDLAESNLTFDGITVTFPMTGDYNGFRHTNKNQKVAYRNCTIKGQQFMYATTAEFINCIFENTANAYCVWTYDSENVTFIDCTFNTAGKAILIYNEKTTESFVGNVTVKHCTFNDDDSIDVIKAAVETGSNANTDTSNKYNILFDNCKVNGFTENDTGIATGSKLWANKNSMDKDHLNVIIDGEDVY